MASPANRPNGIAVQGRRAREFDAPTQEAGGAGYVEEAGRGTPNLLAVVWRQRWIVLLCCLLALSGGVAYLTQATPIYASSSIVYVQQSTPKIMSDVMSTGQRTIGYLFTQCQVIESTAILRSALGKPGVSDLATLRGSANPVATLKYIVRAEPDKQGDLIGVSAESTVPQDAATIVNAVVDSYIEYQGSQHKSTAVEVMRILQKEVDRYESALKGQRGGDAEIEARKSGSRLYDRSRHFAGGDAFERDRRYGDEGAASVARPSNRTGRGAAGEG